MLKRKPCRIQCGRCLWDEDRKRLYGCDEDSFEWALSVDCVRCDGTTWVHGDDGERAKCTACVRGKVQIRRCPFKLLIGTGAFGAVNAYNWLDQGVAPFGLAPEDQTVRAKLALDFVRSEIARREREAMKEKRGNG